MDSLKLRVAFEAVGLVARLVLALSLLEEDVGVEIGQAVEEFPTKVFVLQVVVQIPNSSPVVSPIQW